MANRVLTLILGGGRGTRLYPLTRYRAKPAVPIGGKYRLIDIPISLSIHAGLKSIFILTQFQSHSLHRHIFNTYRFDTFSRGFVEILAAEQTEESQDWYQGTADAVYQQRHRFDRPEWDHILILSGDHLYRMNYRSFIEEHLRSRADVTVASTPVARGEASRFGILKADARGKVREYYEKPKEEKLSGLEWKGAKKGGQVLASMGIYLFRREILSEVLENRDFIDFGRHILPHALSRYRLQTYQFRGYWEDIGTIGAFYEANLKLLSPRPPFSFYSEEAPIFSRPRFLPPTRISGGKIGKALISEGGVISQTEISRSIIGIRSQIRDGAQIKDSIIMGADYYEEDKRLSPNGPPPLGIGRGSIICRAIVDKNARIGEGVVIANQAGVIQGDGDNYAIREGIVIIPKHAVIPSGTVI
jgi:glucose-1-phosphate adenylyltransferase